MSADITELRRTGPSRPVERIARIAALLGELEQLSQSARNVPLPLLMQARTSIEKARGVLENCARMTASAAHPDDREHDPQPEVDNDVLDRLYGSLKAGRRPLER